MAITIPTIEAEAFENEWTVFTKNLTIAGIIDKFDLEALKADMAKSTYGMTTSSSMCFMGSLIIHINFICALSLRFAKMVSATLPVEDSSLLKVCCLQHLSKIEMYVPNDNEWAISHRGEYFKFNENNAKLKCGERSILMAIQRNIIFTDIEYEAMLSMDRISDSVGTRLRDSTLTMIIRSANEFANALELQKKFI